MRINVCFTLPPDVLRMLDAMAENETMGNRSMMVALLIIRAHGGDSNGTNI